jgi:hypothetical protein
MGLGALIWIVGMGIFIFLIWHPRPKPSSRLEIPSLPSIHLEVAAPSLVDRYTPAWQLEAHEPLKNKGYIFVGNYAYTSSNLFFSKIWIDPTAQALIIFVNWIEDHRSHAHAVLTNLEIYSFLENQNFILTAFAQDGALRLLTGANRPDASQLYLKLQSVFSLKEVWRGIEMHIQRLQTLPTPNPLVPILSSASALTSLESIIQVMPLSASPSLDPLASPLKK